MEGRAEEAWVLLMNEPKSRHGPGPKELLRPLFFWNINGPEANFYKPQAGTILNLINFIQYFN